MKAKLFLLALGWLTLTASALAQERPFYLKDGDRVVFYGDSITDQRLYTTFTETFVVTRFPRLEVTFVHSGWGGDRVSGGAGGPIDVRLKRDVFAYHPTVMTIMLGMNDAAYRAFDERIFEPYRNGYQHIIESLKQNVPRLRLTLIQPSPYDDVAQPPRFEGGYNAVLVRYGQYVKELAEREQLDVADLNTAVVGALEKAKATEAEAVKKIIPDRVHPGPAGHLLMAAELLKAWSAPKIVTLVEIDAASRQVVKSEAAKVTGLEANGALTWRQIDAALPMPVDLHDSATALAMKSSDFFQTLNQQTLKVIGLTRDKYELKIDGEPAGDFTKAQLAEGVNLALLPTPMVKQAAGVHQLTLRHNDIHFMRWRQVQVPLANKGLTPRIENAVKALMTTCDEEEAEVIKQQRAAAQPVEHKFELTGQ